MKKAPIFLVAIVLFTTTITQAHAFDENSPKQIGLMTAGSAAAGCALGVVVSRGVKDKAIGCAVMGTFAGATALVGSTGIEAFAQEPNESELQQATEQNSELE